MTLFSLAGVFFSGFILTVILTGLLLPWLKKKAMLDQPNERSSHITPTPYGGGLALITVVILLFIWLAANPLSWQVEKADPVLAWIILGTLILSGISWIDDLRGVPQAVRLAIHFAIVSIVLIAQPGDSLVFQGGLPFWLDRVITAVIWVWFINLFNFMDGIDGISGVETAALGLGVVFLAGTMGWEPLGQTYALVLAGAAIGFLWWNWQPAKVFLGDVGSVPLGFILGWLLIGLAAKGFWVQSLILSLYYLADATLTLVGRIARREKFWQPHRQHYYQQAVRKGLSHAKTASAIGVANIFLIGLTVTSLRAPITGLVGAAAVVFVLLLYFKGDHRS